MDLNIVPQILVTNLASLEQVRGSGKTSRRITEEELEATKVNTVDPNSRTYEVAPRF